MGDQELQLRLHVRFHNEETDGKFELEGPGSAATQDMADGRTYEGYGANLADGDAFFVSRDGKVVMHHKACEGDDTWHVVPWTVEELELIVPGQHTSLDSSIWGTL